MLGIALRRETIKKIRDRVDLEEEFDGNLSSTGPVRPMDAMQHVTLGSSDTATTLGDFLQYLRIPAEFPQPKAAQLLRSMNTCLFHNCDLFDVQSSSELKVSHTEIIYSQN
jgi:hypothetical protein